jgi:hypothetical protein
VETPQNELGRVIKGGRKVEERERKRKDGDNDKQVKTTKNDKQQTTKQSRKTRNDKIETARTRTTFSDHNTYHRNNDRNTRGQNRQMYLRSRKVEAGWDYGFLACSSLHFLCFFLSCLISFQRSNGI